MPQLDYLWPKADPRVWLELPPVILGAYVRQMRRMEARDILKQYQATVLGSGNVKKSAAQRALRKLQKVSEGSQRTKPVNLNKDEFEAKMRSLGFGVKVVQDGS